VAEFRERGYLPEALVNYLALLGWSPGRDEELVPLADMASRFDLTHVSHSAAVFDVPKLAWVNRHYMKEAAPDRLVLESMRYFLGVGFVTRATDAAKGYIESLLGMAVGSVDRLEEIPSRVAFVFEWDAARAAALVRAEPDGVRAVAAFAQAVTGAGPLDREAFRSAAGRAREQTGLKGRALFHPIRVALSAAESGPELDLAVPAIDRGAGLGPDSGVAPVRSCADRLATVVSHLGT
jgi:glutamyl-tRNA synthetase/nondiscriminating glutamyl-tRNA synthetase